MFAIQKIARNGNSMSVTLPRPMLFVCNWLPGDFVKLETLPDGAIKITGFEIGRNVGLASPGVIPERVEPPKP
jgi:antitoxin component of MazEF toxin-antitoxin module